MVLRHQVENVCFWFGFKQKDDEEKLTFVEAERRRVGLQTDVFQTELLDQPVRL